MWFEVSQWEANRLLRRIVLSIVCIWVTSTHPAVAQSESEIVEPIEPPAVTTALPADVPAVVLLNTTAERWGVLNQFNPLAEKISGPGQLTPYLSLDVNFSEVQPWVGEWGAIALMPPANTTIPARLQENPTVMVFPVTDTAGMNAFVEKLKQTRQQTPLERNHLGVSILSWPAEQISINQGKNEIAPLAALKQAFSPVSKFLAQAQPTPEPPPPPFIRPAIAIALLPDFIAIASNPAPLQQLISSQNQSSLSENPEFLRILEHPEFMRSLTVGYGDLNQIEQLAIAPVVAKQSIHPLLPLPSLGEIVLQLKPLAANYTHLHALVWVQEEGIRVQTLASYKNPPAETAIAPFSPDSEILERIPAASYLSIVGENFAQQWQNLVNAAPNQPFAKQIVDHVRQLSSRYLNLDIDREIIPWMDGEYALFLYPTNQGYFNLLNPQFKIGLGFIVETSDRIAADQAFSKLDQHITAQSEEFLTITSREIDSQSVTSWEIPQDGRRKSLFARSWLTEDTLILTSGSGALQEIYPYPYLRLNNAQTFQNAIAPFPQPNHGYSFVNMGSFLALIYGLLPPEIANAPDYQTVNQVLRTIRSFSLSNSSTPTAAQTDLFLVLLPAR